MYKQILICRSSIAKPCRKGETDKGSNDMQRFLGHCGDEKLNYLDNKMEDSLENIIYMSTVRTVLIAVVEQCKISKYIECKSTYMCILIEFLQDLKLCWLMDTEEIMYHRHYGN